MAQIRKIAKDSRMVLFSDHALQRMELRGFTDLDVLRVLRMGELRGNAEPGMGTGEWKCKIVAKKPGQREIGVVALTIRKERLLIKTVEFEDL
jgi:hypothetical protein